MNNTPNITKKLLMAFDPSFLFEDIKIGSCTFPRIMAAPLDGITDSPLRKLIREFSPRALLFTEMRHVACVANEKSGIHLRYGDQEKPLCYQVSANREEFIPKAMEKIIDAGFDMLNLNIGCPAPTVTKSGSGSALMAKPEILEPLIGKIVQELKGKIPFTVKIRAGFKEKNGLFIAKLCEQAGAQMLIIHPRTAPGGFTSLLDYDLTRQIKSELKIPVIFSGNITSYARVQKVHELTGVDGFMIGRALWGCPWKMAEIEAHANNLPFKVSPLTSIQNAQKHLSLNLEHYGFHGFRHFKKQVVQYLRGLPQAALMRKHLLTSQTPEEMKHVLEQVMQQAEAGFIEENNNQQAISLAT